MTYEVEQKYIVNDLLKIEKTLRRMEVAIGPVIYQSDIYFSHPCRDFSSTDEAFRIRQVDDLNFLTYKGPRIDSNTSTRLEKEIPLPDGREYADQMIQLLGILGFNVFTTVKKQRRIASVCNNDVAIEIALDRVEHLGEFVELEVFTCQDKINAAKQAIAGLADKLELIRSERLSYCELMQKSR